AGERDAVRVAVGRDAAVDARARVGHGLCADVPAVPAVGRAEDGLLLAARPGLAEADDPAEPGSEDVGQSAEGEGPRARARPTSRNVRPPSPVAAMVPTLQRASRHEPVPSRPCRRSQNAIAFGTAAAGGSATTATPMSVSGLALPQKIARKAENA